MKSIYLTAAALIAVGLVIGCFSVHEYRRYSSSLTQWKKVPAKVLGGSRKSGRKTDTLSVAYEYKVKEQTYTATNIGFGYFLFFGNSLGDYHAGGSRATAIFNRLQKYADDDRKINIYYDPTDPQTAVVDRFLSVWNHVAMAAAVCCLYSAGRLIQIGRKKAAVPAEQAVARASLGWHSFPPDIYVFWVALALLMVVAFIAG